MLTSRQTVLAEALDDTAARLRGILLMIGAFASFAVLDASAKFLGPALGNGQIVFARYAVALALVLLVVPMNGGWEVFATRYRLLHVLRGLLLLGATSLNFLAVNYLQLAQTAAIVFSNPLIVCALSPFLLRERVGPRRWFAVLVGFIGVLIVVRPGTAGFHWAMLLSLGVAFCGALYQIITRKVGGSDRALTSLLWVSIIGTIGAVPFAPFGWATPSLAALAILLLMGLCGAGGHMMLIQAHRLAPAPLLAPFIYTQIVFMVAIGFVVFGDVPDRWTLLGGFVVIAAGLYVYYRERRLKLDASKA